MSDLRPVRGRALDYDGRLALVRRLLRERAISRAVLPPACQPLGAMEVLLTILIAEDNSEQPCTRRIAAALEVELAIAERWVLALAQLGFADVRGDGVALTRAGYDTIACITERICLS